MKISSSSECPCEFPRTTYRSMFVSHLNILRHAFWRFDLLIQFLCQSNMAFARPQIRPSSRESVLLPPSTTPIQARNPLRHTTYSSVEPGLEYSVTPNPSIADSLAILPDSDSRLAKTHLIAIPSHSLHLACASQTIPATATRLHPHPTIKPITSSTKPSRTLLPIISRTDVRPRHLIPITASVSGSHFGASYTNTNACL